MRLSAGLPLTLLWAVSTDALNTYRPRNVGLEKRLSNEEKCKLTFETTDLDVVAKTWKDSGADAFLTAWILKYGASDWDSEIIRTMVSGGEGGSTIDCQNFPVDNACRPPNPGSCKTFIHPEMFFIQESMGNLYGMFSGMHEDLQDYVIEQLASGIKDVVADFASPKANNQVMTMLIGAFVTAAGAAGPFWVAGAPLTFAVGIFNFIAGAINSKPPDLDANGTLEKQLGDVFERAKNELQSAIIGFFSGVMGDTILLGPQFGGLKVTNVFSDGKFLSSKITDAARNSWQKAATHQMVSV